MRLDHLLSKEGRSRVCITVYLPEGQDLPEAGGRNLAAMRPGETRVPIPNTRVKAGAADGTMLETAWESRRLPDYQKKNKVKAMKLLLWGCSSAGRAPALQAGGQGFEPLHLHCV